jgi:superfamily I DNA/RNA helicase
VRASTTHKTKGLEYRCVPVAGVDSPPAAAITPVAEDPLAHRQDQHRERRLLFVARTRARNSLHMTHPDAASHFPG